MEAEPVTFHSTGQSLQPLGYSASPTCKEANVGLAGLKGTASLSHYLLPLLLQCGHLGQRGRSSKETLYKAVYRTVQLT